MPLYEYKCPVGHRTNILRKMEDRDLPTSCDCGMLATLAVSHPARGIVTGSETPGGVRNRSTSREGFTVLEESETFVMRQRGSAPDLEDWVCADGHRAFEVYLEGQRPTHTPDCLVCGKPTKRIVGVPSPDWFTQEHPDGYFEPALGRWIRSRAHMEEVKRELGVVEMDWRQPLEDQLRRDSVRDAHDEAVVRKMIQSYETGPDAAVLKKARDEGRVLDWSEHAKNLGVAQT